MALEIGGNSTRHQRVRGHAVLAPAGIRADGKENIRRLGLAIGGPRVILAECEIDVIEDDRRK